MGIMIDKDSLLKDKTLGESTYLNPDTNYTPVAIVRDIEDEIHNETIIPRSHNILKEGDTAYFIAESKDGVEKVLSCLLYTSPSPRDKRQSRMPSSA